MNNYIDRSSVREILCGVADEHVDIAETLLMDVDALPITALPPEWIAFYEKYQPTAAELQELIRRIDAAR